MKMVSTITLGLALALSSAAVVGVQPAVAAKKEKAPKAELTPAVREAVAAAQAAMAKEPKDVATATAQAATARAGATTPDDKFYAGSVSYDVGRNTNDKKLQGEALDLMLSSGKVPAESTGNFWKVRGVLAYESKDYPKADQAFTQAIQAGDKGNDTYALAADAKDRIGKPAEALALLQQAISQAEAAGKPLPSEYYGRGIAIGYKAKLAPQVESISQSWLKAYPTQDNWRDSLIVYRDLNKIDADYELDLMRLMRTAKAMKGESDYYTYAEATYIKFPGEGKAVIDEGVASGMLKLTAGSNIKAFSDQANSRVGADKADLPGAAASAAKAGNGVAARATGDSYLGYGDYAKAAEMYRLALQKGGVDANVVNTRLGMALARAGQKEEARTVFSSITGPRQSLAKYWLIWLDQQA
ncbi:hypothetical protein SAMN06295912_108157 [Sphingomonas laterariae]|uniref:Tetratricopeptide repeat-containing protein n=1 Tax=Edaphosphingomonas laterariae TaxID=861865 RepID=A0A239FBE1_9SPHN|nr:hypothetical protein [Sphingomonas laterariae]SNS54095.1 hypothetical protein SAMN06295912_108157 [Sphingomonas laterariae]